MHSIKGFTLIELLVVIVLIGIMGSITMLSIGSGNQRDQQRQEAERLLQLLQLASQEAIIRGMPVALECYRHGYRFITMDDGRWQAEIDDAVFKPRTLHPQIAIDLTIENRAVLLRDREHSPPDPQIVFTPDGDMNEFQVNIGLQDSDERFSVGNTLKDGLALSMQTAASRL